MSAGSSMPQCSWAQYFPVAPPPVWTSSTWKAQPCWMEKRLSEWDMKENDRGRQTRSASGRKGQMLMKAVSHSGHGDSKCCILGNWTRFSEERWKENTYIEWTVAGVGVFSALCRRLAARISLMLCKWVLKMFCVVLITRYRAVLFLSMCCYCCRHLDICCECCRHKDICCECCRQHQLLPNL